MTSRNPAAKFFSLALPIVAFSLVFATSTVESCHAQNFTGNGDGFSWHDRFNWQFGNVPGEFSRATISPTPETGFSVQIDLPTTVSEVLIRSSEFQPGGFRTASLTVNSQLSANRRIQCGGESGFFNVNADVNFSGGTLAILDGATLNLNSGTLTGRVFAFVNSNFSNASPTFNQNGGRFNVEIFSIERVTTTATIGPNDNVTSELSVFGGAVICQRPLIIDRFVQVSAAGTLTTNHDLTAVNFFSLSKDSGDAEPPTLVWNHGDIATARFSILNGVINRTGGRLLVEDFGLDRTRALGMDHFTVREDDVISGEFSIDGTSVFPVATTFEGPHNLEAISQGQSITVNYEQDLGETEGLAIGRYFNFFDGTLNLGFDSQSVGGLDWVLRVDGNEVEELEDFIDDGRIVVTGADFSVEYDAADDATFIQQTTTTLIGDVNLDGAVTFGDIPSFIAVLSSGDFQAEADCNLDGAVNFADISAFIDILVGL